MDTASFLQRTIAGGGWIVICFQTDKGRFGTRFFPPGEYAQAASFVQYCNWKNWDSWHATASYTTAVPSDKQDPKGNVIYGGKRDQANALRIQCFWLDLDVKREGDKKVAGTVFDTRKDAMVWLGAFYRAVGLPPPNQVVNSGYGFHAYWILETDMGTAEWRPYAEGLRVAVQQNGYTGDVGVIADSARLLRPAGALNVKVRQAPIQVEVIDRLTQPNYANALVLDALRPFIALAGQSVATGSGPPLLTGGPAAAFAGTAAPDMNAAAQANLPANRRDIRLAVIAQQCGQVATSLANHGKGEDRYLWHLGSLSLAHFCSDGKDYVHALGDGDPRYSPANTEAFVNLVAHEVKTKGLGPPTCGYYAKQRPAICHACPQWGRIRSPIVLGVPDGDLPTGYRRTPHRIEKFIPGKDGGFWVEVIPGNVSQPMLNELRVGGYALTFRYERSGKTYAVRWVDDMSLESEAVRRHFAPQYITLDRDGANIFGEFLVAWIQRLRDLRAERVETVHPFGWVSTPAKPDDADQSPTISGFAVAGDVYRASGVVEQAPGGDRQLNALYKPSGNLSKWKECCTFVTTGKPGLQAIVAANFGAPLMRLLGYPGVLINAWSSDSGVGKTSALDCGQAVWAAPSAKNNLDDTANAIMRKIGDTRAMPSNWDEVRLASGDGAAKFVLQIFSLAQGKEKARLNSDTSLRSTAEWETLIIACSNSPLVDIINAENEHTDAGAKRCFSFPLPYPKMPQDPLAHAIVTLSKDHYGRAGRVYAEWLAANVGTARAHLATLTGDIIKTVRADQSERLLVAAATAMMGGAIFAKRLGLVDWDMRALYGFLCQQILDMRKGRETETASATSGGGVDLQQILSEFINAHNDKKMATAKFLSVGNTSRTGPADKRVEIKWFPQHRSIAIHIGLEEQIMRIDRRTLSDWCRKRSVSPRHLIESMGTAWKATQERRVLGAGTGYAAGQMWVVEIPLSDPDLSGYLYDSTAQVDDPSAPRPRKDDPHGH